MTISQKINITLNALFLLFNCLLLSSYTHATPKTINIGADPWCPYNCDPEEQHHGIMVDVARQAFALSGYKLNYQIINWARAKQLVKNGNLDGIIGMARNPSSELLYYFSNTALGQSQVCLYRRSRDKWRFKSVNSLGQRSFGWINDYGFANDPLDTWVKERKHTKQITIIAGEQTYQRLFKLLQVERIDTFAEDRNVIAYELKKSGLGDEIKIAGCLSSIDNVHLAFSLESKNKEIWAKALESGVRKLRYSGQLNKILSVYGLNVENWLKSTSD